MLQTNLRPYQGQSDHPTIAELDHLMGLGMLNYCDPACDMVFAEADGQTIGYGRVWLNVRDDEHRYHLEVSLRNRTAMHVEQRLFDWVQVRAAAMRQVHSPGITCSNKFFVPDSRSSLIQLLRENGYTIERTDLTMTRLLSDPIPDAPLPAGIELRPIAWQHGHKLAAAMADCFGYSGHDAVAEMDEAEFDQWLSGTPATAADSLAAWSIADDDVVCMTLNQVDHDAGRGSLNHICTRLAWRGRGLASALITHCLRTFQAHCLRKAHLGVNDFNTAAMRVYEHVGFAVSSRVYLYSKK